MAIKLINGTHIENLTAELASELKAERAAKGPFEFLKVAVANPNFGNWLKMKVLSKKRAVVMGTEAALRKALTTSVERDTGIEV